MRKPGHRTAPCNTQDAVDRVPGLQLLLSAVISSVIFLASPVQPIFAGNAGLPAVVGAATDQSQGDSKDGSHPGIVRWKETVPGCTFSRDEDGKYSYGLWMGDIGVVVAVDARELQLLRHRIEPVLAVLLTLHYRGTANLDATANGITLEFVEHFKVVQPALDPDSYSQKIQADADAMDDETRRAIRKHPEEKQVRIAGLQEYEKSANELIEFLNSKSLRTVHLDRATPDASGWVFFSTDNKWIGSWKPQEEFVLHVRLGEKTFEFPFELPPAPGELLLRKRP